MVCGLDHSGSQPFNYSLALPAQSYWRDYAKFTCTFTCMDAPIIHLTSTPLQCNIIVPPESKLM